MNTLDDYELRKIRYAKESGARARINKERERRPFFSLGKVLREGLLANPYSDRTGNYGKKLKAAWHNGYQEQDKLSA